ncbi:MAG: pilus assembly PilX N-terminal domain-containing protein [Verrucomicrobia bacterium]|nr:pilus assembly PilX N-terminal domain-containing protein [Verrucomicrobiota bacterium]
MKTHASSKQGSALFVVLIIIISMSALLTVVVKGGLQQAFSARKLSDRIRAQLIAEAGAHQAYNILKADWSERNSDAAFPLTSYGGGDTMSRLSLPTQRHLSAVRGPMVRRLSWQSLM